MLQNMHYEKTLDKISVEKKSESNDAARTKSSLTAIRTRSNTVFRAPPSSTIPPSHLPCVVCGKLQHNGTREKFRICKSARANRFIETVFFYFQDEIYTRIADLEEDSRVFGADLYYHNCCMEAYLGTFVRQINPDSGPCNQNRQRSLKREEFLKEKSSLEGLLKNGYGISLSEFRELINDKNGENFFQIKRLNCF